MIELKGREREKKECVMMYRTRGIGKRQIKKVVSKIKKII